MAAITLLRDMLTPDAALRRPEEAIGRRTGSASGHRPPRRVKRDPRAPGGPPRRRKERLMPSWWRSRRLLLILLLIGLSLGSPILFRTSAQATPSLRSISTSPTGCVSYWYVSYSGIGSWTLIN